MHHDDVAPSAPASVEGLLSPLEAACLRALWVQAPAAVAAVRAQVNTAQPAPLAYTTIMTVLARLHEKGLATRSRRGRGYVYSPAYTETQLIEELGGRDVQRLVERYGGVALAHFAAALRRSDPTLLAELRALAESDADADHTHRAGGR